MGNTNYQTEGNQRLTSRGILNAANEMGWEPYALKRGNTNIWGWKLPIWDVTSGGKWADPQTGKPVLRWKNFDSKSESEPEYQWLGSKNNHPRYYAHPTLLKAIKDNDGLIYIAAGEPDLLSYHSAGIYNAVSWLNGETSVPKDLATMLTEWQVKRVVHFPDLDDAGMKSATKTRDALYGSLIEFSAFRLPDYLPEKGDINYLWKWYEFDTTKFLAELDRIQADPNMCIQEPEVQKPTLPVINGAQRTTYTLSSSDWDEMRKQWILGEVMSKLELQSPIAAGIHRHCPSPNHPDNNPSFRISYDRDTDVGIPQCSCDIQNEPHPWEKVADWVGARPFMDWWHAERKSDKGGSKTHVGSSYEIDDRSADEAYDDEFGDAPETKLTKGGRPKTPTDDEVGDMLLAKWSGQVRYIRDKWHQYTNGVWLELFNVDGQIWDVMREAKALEYHPSKNKGASIQDYLKSKLYVEPRLVDQASNYINLANGLYNLETQTLEPHRPDLFFTRQLGFAHDPDASCPNWNSFLVSTFADEHGNPIQGVIDLLQEAIGYSHTPYTNLHKGFWLYGKPASGKSTILGVLKALLGSAYMTVDFNQLRSNPYQLAMIPGRLVVACAEGKSGSKAEDHLLKCLMTGEEMQLRQIYGKPFMYAPQAKVWWAMNELPVNSDRSGALDRRLVIFTFSHTVPENQRDVHLIDKLTSELPGIFNWAMRGLQRLQLQRSFTVVDSIQEAVNRYQNENDTELAFLEDQEWCEMSPEDAVQSSDLYIAYGQWCIQNGYRPKGSNLVARDWERLKLIRDKTNRYNVWCGVRLTGSAQGIVASYRRNTGGRSHPRPNYPSANLYWKW